MFLRDGDGLRGGMSGFASVLAKTGSAATASESGREEAGELWKENSFDRE